jgi:processive 1,2-diacylglycerol beta-glucosyltransferase
LRKKRVLLLSEGFGSGHTQAAKAISMGLKQLSKSITTRVLELGAFQHPTLAPWIFSAYRKTVTNTPQLVGKLYKTYNKKSFSRLSSLALHRIFYSRTANIIRQLKPDLIISTHPFPTVIVSRLIRAGLTTPLCTVITDYDAHGSWVDSAVNYYMVSTSEVKEKLILRGISSDVIRVTGIPVHPKFWGIPNREETRLSFKLQDMPTVLIMGGGWGMIDNAEMMNYIAEWREQIQLIFCTGDNEKVLHKLSEDHRFKHPNIHLFGFTKDIDKLMDISDLLITKPGGMTCTEAMSKGIPMLFYSPIPGQEEENSHYFIENGFGEEIQSVATIKAWFLRLLSDEYPLLLQNRISNHLNIKYSPQFCTESIIELYQL